MTKSKDRRNKNEGIVKRSIAIRMIRHAESKNNEVYRDARRLFKGGSPEFDADGWHDYVDKHHLPDPSVSATGKIQAEKLKDYLVPHLDNQASTVRIITSPMRRTMETILPTLRELKRGSEIIVNGLYFESGGCYDKGNSVPGMNQIEIKDFLSSAVACSGASNSTSHPSFVGFDEDPHAGWYSHAKGPETRKESEGRAAAFFTWLCDHLDSQLLCNDDDLFDAGAALPDEDHEHDCDKLSPKLRRRRTVVLVGHGDFMSLVLKRIVSGFGHFVENDGIPHRSAFVHLNTGITELEYFGQGRFLLMHTNQTPHLEHDINLKTGGGLKDGWSYLMPRDEIMLNQEITSAFADEHETHVMEQVDALKKLYVVDSQRGSLIKRRSAEIMESFDKEERNANKSEIIFVAKRGSQVAGCITFNEEEALASDMVVRPSARGGNIEFDLIQSVKQYAIKSKKKEMFLKVCDNSKQFLHKQGFVPLGSKTHVYKLTLIDSQHLSLL